MKIKASDAQAEEHCDAVCKTRVRDRIFDKASELFYRQGIRAVGVDAIACEAGTNKMSFYRSFVSKDELVAEYLRDAEARFWVWWDAVVAPYAGKPRRQAEALFATFVDKPCEKTDQGCALGNAAVEIRDRDHPGFTVVCAHKNEIRRRFRKLARDMKARDPEVLGDGLTLLMAGVASSRLTYPAKTGPAINVARVAKTMIEAHLKA